MRGGTVALIGSPVGESISPAMHRAAFQAAGLGLDYVAVEVAASDLVEAFPRLHRSFLGLNVTRPLKEAVLQLLDRLSPEAAECGSVNTVEFRDGSSVGHSTDGDGFLAALARSGAPRSARALIVGTGGAARAVAFALRAKGTEVMIWGRNAEAGGRLIRDLLREPAAPAAVWLQPEDVRFALQDSDLVVNATPQGAAPGPAGDPVPEDFLLHEGLTVFDLVYRPRRTPLLRRAEAAGCRTVEGVEMLVEQGARSFSIWTGLPAPVQAMRAAAYEALEFPVRPVPPGAGGRR